MPDCASHMGRRGIVRYPVDPGSQCASLIEARQAAPERRMNVLEQIPAQRGVGLISGGEAFHRGSEFDRAVRVQLVCLRA